MPEKKRNPLTSPRFGDVFEIDTSTRVYRAMYVRPGPDFSEGWIGLQLMTSSGKPLMIADVGEVRSFVSLSAWRFVE